MDEREEGGESRLCEAAHTRQERGVMGLERHQTQDPEIVYREESLSEVSRALLPSLLMLFDVRDSNSVRECDPV